MDPLDALTALHVRHAHINTCTLKDTALRPVFGIGNPCAKVVCIGEAPGKKEDQTGVPFVGAAGKFLDEMLESIGMSRRASVNGARNDFAKLDIYITNIVKYRPPDNRDPTSLEKDACKDWLHAELLLINPKLIVFLGRHAMNHFFPLEKISDVHGTLLVKKFPDFETTHFLPLYHPAAALYNGGLRQELLKDFKKIPLVLAKIGK